MLELVDLSGLWTRSLMAWPDGRRDTTTVVGWLQGQSAYADLRQPPGHAELFHPIRCLRDLRMIDCQRLAEQQAFAGQFVGHGQGVFEWLRHADYQPPCPTKDIGRLYWQDDILIEEGLQAEYIEYWHPDMVLRAAPCAALMLQDAFDGRFGQLIRVGDKFMFVRDRAAPVTGATLAAALETANDLAAAQAMIDFEISFGDVSDAEWRITRSTLPYRAASLLCLSRTGNAGLRTGDIAADGGAAARDWVITACEGDTSMFFDGMLETL